MKKEVSLNQILKQLNTVSGFRMSLYDPDMTLIAAYPEDLTSFCALVQKDAKAFELCCQYDALAAKTALETGEVYLYRCHCGLYEAVAPLYHFGILSGYLMMGQTLDSQSISRDFVVQCATPYVQDQAALLKAVRSIPRRTREQILSCISIMEICASYLSLNNYLKAADKELPARIRAFLKANFDKDITIEELCEAFYVSRSTLTACFRKAYRKSIMEYITDLRMEHALKLLTTTDLTIHQIASECGYDDQNYFTKVFRKQYDKTPTQMKHLQYLPLLK